MAGKRNRYLGYSNKDEQRSNVQSLFNNIAPRYDLANTLLSFGIDKRWRAKAVAALNLTGASKVLDLATGTGELAKSAMKKTPCSIVGVDPAFDMLSQTTRKLDRLPGEFAAIEAFGEALPLADNSFTHAMISYGIRNVSDRPRVFKEIFRVLQPGGRFLILEFSDPSNKAFAKLYRFYFHSILSRLGGLISGDFDAYTYLPKTVAAFVTPDELAEECKQAGFIHEMKKPMTFGVTTMLTFLKE